MDRLTEGTNRLLVDSFTRDQRGHNQKQEGFSVRIQSAPREQQPDHVLLQISIADGTAISLGLRLEQRSKEEYTTTTELAIIAGSKPASQPVLRASRKVRR
jgi:hypothetical protein